MKKVLVFGIFDGLHEGHMNFLKQAKDYGDFLVVAVGQDEAVKKFKSKIPKYPFKKRVEMVGNAEYVDKVIEGDKKQGSYNVIKKENPDIICLGYDQKKLGKDLEKWLAKNGLKIPLKYQKPHKPKEFHTSIIDEQSR